MVKIVEFFNPVTEVSTKLSSASLQNGFVDSGFITEYISFGCFAGGESSVYGSTNTTIGKATIITYSSPQATYEIVPALKTKRSGMASISYYKDTPLNC